MSEITQEILMQFKNRMRLGDDEDENLLRILKASHQALFIICGRRNINEDEVYKELVFNRSRYEYNDAIEYFNKHFQNEINTLGIESAINEMSVGNAGV